MNTHAQNSVFSEINILIVQHLLLRIFVDLNEPAIDKIGKKNPQKNTSQTEL